MDHKKKLLIKVLEKLQPQWNLAEGILALVKSSYADDKAIDGIVHIISNSIKRVKNTQEKNMLTEGLEKIKKIQRLENNETISDKELDKLLADI
ncbi:MAG: hypothetical protein WCP92_04575 [bacterium]